MAKRLSKALRGKRRWFGLAFDSRFLTRQDMQENLDVIAQKLDTDKRLRLMDFIGLNHEPNSKFELTQFDDFPFQQFGLAIVEVPLEVSSNFRELVAINKSEKVGIISLTSSGKISLVRRRLNLPKPVRRK
tara:strand:+ start:15867 stop:16259 length:393 start_codon:yes stop_codon:yes gene_type:complete